MSKLQKVHGASAGIDVGSCKFFVGTEETEVQNFDTFTSGCYELVEYLQQKNISSVVSAVQLVSVMKIIEAILAGERDAKKLATLCDKRIQKNKEAEILKSLEGFYKEEQLYALQHAYDEYEFYEGKIKQCDKKMETILKKTVARKKEPTAKATGKRVYHHRPAIDELDKMMMQLYEGKDLTILPGLTCYSVLKFYSVVGSDFSNWKTEKAFTAYLGLAPSKYQTGKSRKYRKFKCNTEGGQI